MEKEQFQALLRESLSQINEPRFYNNERGFQCKLSGILDRKLSKESIWPGQPIIEQEYQKLAREHGLTIRPDIIIHIPFERRADPSRMFGNYAVIELKRNATRNKALADYNNLNLMCQHLNYPHAVFINIGSSETFIESFTSPYIERFMAYGVVLQEGIVSINERTAA